MKLKKTIYIFSSTVLGVILSYVIHAAAEVWYIARIESLGKVVEWHYHFGIGSCALPPLTQYLILTIGLVGGIFLGFFWWRVVYIEHRHWSFHKNKNNQQSS